MQISHNGIEFLKQEEGFRSEAYLDTGGVPTIGYGTTHVDGHPIRMGDKCTPEQAEQWLYADIAYVQTAINQLVKKPLRQQMFDALVSFVYNEGVGAFTSSTILRLLNLGEYSGAAQQFSRWIWDGKVAVPGLVARRNAEEALFNS